MKIETCITCEKCGRRIEYDTEIECYLEHKHGEEANKKSNPYDKLKSKR